LKNPGIYDREAFYLSTIFIREALYSSLRKTGFEKSWFGKIASLFLPSVSDNIVAYNLKWFVSGMIIGLIMSLWIPLLIHIMLTIYRVRLIMLITSSALIMMMLISILVSNEFIQNIIASINELALWRKIEFLPLKYETIEKAASYSIIVGGGITLVSGMGLGIGLTIYLIVNSVSSIIMVPLGFTTSITLITPLAIILYHKFGGRVNPLISLLVHVLLIIGILTLYLNSLAFGTYDQVLKFLENYKYIFPFPFIYTALEGFELSSSTISLCYFLFSLALSSIIPSRYGVKLITGKRIDYGKSIIIKYSKVLSLCLKDLLISIRDNLRLKQFYGQLAALITPLVVTLLNSEVIKIIHSMEYLRTIILSSFIGLISYFIAVIVTPILLFTESDRSRILLTLPVKSEDVVIARTLTSTILYLPVAIIVSLLITILISIVHGLYLLYSSITYWITGSYLSYKVIIHMLWGREIAWTDLSLGVLKRFLIIIFLSIPLAILLSILLLFYYYNPFNSLIILVFTPLPILVYIVLYASTSE